MPVKDLEIRDRKTGEILEGFPVLVGRKIVSPYGRDWVQVNQSALAEIAADRDMGTEAFRVFLYLNSRLDFENEIWVPQADMVAALGMKRQAIGRAVKLLTDKKIIVRGEKVGVACKYMLNPDYGWKGKIKNFPQARQRHLALVKSNEETTDPSSGADS
jgi:hypothetical protein